MVKALQKRWK